MMHRHRRTLLILTGIIAVAALVLAGSATLYQWAMGSDTQFEGTSRPTIGSPTSTAPPASTAPTAAPTVSTPSRSTQTTEPRRKPRRSGPKRFTVIGDGVPTVVRRAGPIIGTPDTEYLWWATADMDMSTATDLAREHRDDLGQVVVLAMGSAEPITRAAVDDFAVAIGEDRALVLVGPGGTGSAKEGLHPTNVILYQLAQERPSTYFVDWQTDVDTNPRLVSDRVVPTATGSATWMARVNWTVNTAFAAL